MKVKIHPHKPKCDKGLQRAISVTPLPANRGVYYMGTVILHDVYFIFHPSGYRRFRESGVRNVHFWAAGELILQTSTQHHPTYPEDYRRMFYDLDTGLARDIETRESIFGASRLFAVGKHFYYIPE